VAFIVVQLIPGLTAVETMGPDAFLILAIWCLLGFLFYLRTVVRSSATANMGASASGAVLFALLLYSSVMWLAKRLMAAESVYAVRSTLKLEGSIMLAVIFIGLGVMIHIQRLVRKKHDALRRQIAKAEKPSDSGGGNEAA
jgi:hypothetical protein